MNEIYGKKLGMTRVFVDDGEAVPVSVIEAGPCIVIDRKTTERDGYESTKVGFGEKKEKYINQPQLGVFKKAGVKPSRYVKELQAGPDIKVGDEIKVAILKKGERVDITGISKGLGFQGAMRRHGFSGAQTTHGQSDRMRAPGSIGSSSYPSRVFKGMHMAGKTGKDRVTVLNLEVVQVIEDQNLLLVKGAVPGKKGTLLKIRKTNRAREIGR
nr:50S ribosomal protein L3 [candidate division Zixibacteria bacterium]